MKNLWKFLTTSADGCVIFLCLAMAALGLGAYALLKAGSWLLDMVSK